MDINGKVAIVTGASGGIGLATARLFAQHGAKVALAARSAEKLNQLATELPDSLAVPTDMRDAAAITQMVDAVQQHYGHVDILINNAGQGMYMPIEQIKLDDYRSTLELNVVSVIAAMQAVIPLMRQQGGGSIVNISSGLSKMIVPGVGAYASTKYALNAISLTARAELANDHIQVSVMYPGVTATDFADNSIKSEQRSRTSGFMTPETPEAVAEKILEAVQTGEAEVYADNLKAAMSQ